MKHSLCFLIKSDLYRYCGEVSFSKFIKCYFTQKGFRFSVWMRAAKHFDSVFLVRWLPKLMFMYQKRTQCSDLDYRFDVGPGFSIYHVFGTANSKDTVLGSNVTMCHGVTFGQRAGKYPTIGDYVYISPGACIIGDIKIGNHVLIGPNAFVTESVPDHGVVIGNPAQVISNKGSRKYIRNPFHG